MIAKQIEDLFELIKELIKFKFYGSLEVKFEAGNITIVRKTETIKL